MKGRILFSFFVFVFMALLMPLRSFASESVSFPSCVNPQGEVVANNPTGNHGVPGDETTYTGTDTVYAQSQENFLQCLCTNGSGMQTNWMYAADFSQNQITTYEAQGWVYVPNGADWGLATGPYLAQNLALSCEGSTTSSNTGSTSSDPNQSTLAPVCNDQVPGGAPVITSLVPGENSVTITWTKAPNPVTSYLLAYGTQPGVYQFGNPNIGDQNTTTYTVQDLSGGQTYYLAVRAQNGCQPGPFSQEISNYTSGPYLSSPAKGFTSVLSTQSKKPNDVFAAASICASCFWWPVLLGEILALVALYMVYKTKKVRGNRVLLGAGVAIAAYIVFLIINKGHVCPDGSITLWIFSLPCRYFWVFDAGVYALLTWILRNTKKPLVKKTK